MSDHDQNTAFSGGAVVGYSRQFDHYLVGLEGDVADGSNALRVTACALPDGCWTPAHDSFTTHNEVKEGVTAHVRIRLGYVEGATLFYVAGGYSVADTKMNLIGDCYDPADPTVPTIYNFSRSKTLSGFNVGAGVEHALTDHVTVRAEYLYDDFGSQLYRGSAPEWNDRRVSLDNSVFRVAANYHF